MPIVGIALCSQLFTPTVFHWDFWSLIFIWMMFVLFKFLIFQNERFLNIRIWTSVNMVARPNWLKYSINQRCVVHCIKYFFHQIFSRFLSPAGSIQLKVRKNGYWSWYIHFTAIWSQIQQIFFFWKKIAEIVLSSKLIKICRSALLWEIYSRNCAHCDFVLKKWT